MAEGESPGGGGPEALDELCGYAAGRHHQALRLDLRRVAGLVRPLAEDGPPGPAVVALFDDIATYLERHLTKEEHILFPALTALAEALRLGQPRPPLPFPTLLNPVRLLEGEHAWLHERMERLREVTAGVAFPVDGGEPWRRAYEGLAALDADLAEHVRFEHDVLFPQALEVERRLG